MGLSLEPEVAGVTDTPCPKQFSGVNMLLTAGEKLKGVVLLQSCRGPGVSPSVSTVRLELRLCRRLLASVFGVAGCTLAAAAVLWPHVWVPW
jgi:hypothetical protein